MKKFKLTTQERSQLEQRRLARDGRIVRRAQALIWLEEGRSITEVAKLSGVSRQIYNWIDYFKSRRSPQALEDSLRTPSLNGQTQLE